MSRKLSLVAMILFVFGCARQPIKDPKESLRLAPKQIQLSDDLDFSNFAVALKANISALEKSSKDPIRFGSYEISKKEYLLALENLLKQIQSLSKEQTLEYISAHFVPLEVYGGKSWSEVFITSYYEPIIEGSLKKTKRFTQALYETPKDLVLVRIHSFAERFEKSFLSIDELKENKIRNGLRGRFIQNKSSLSEIVPYYSRAEIDSVASPLSKTSRILAWVDPVDAFFMHIQGSGRVLLPNKKEVILNYSNQNGHEYVAIGRFLFDQIPKEQMSLQKIEEHLASLSREQQQELLNKNPSYVFFSESKRKAVTALGNEALAGRTIATDAEYFPKGALAFLEFNAPEFNSDNPSEIQFKKSSRFVFDQDIGGAIKGPGRVDLYWGSGADAKKHSGVVKSDGRLYYLLPRTIKEQL